MENIFLKIFVALWGNCFFLHIFVVLLFTGVQFWMNQYFLLHIIPDGVLQADMVALALHLRVSIVT